MKMRGTILYSLLLPVFISIVLFGLVLAHEELHIKSWLTLAPLIGALWLWVPSPKVAIKDSIISHFRKSGMPLLVCSYVSMLVLLAVIGGSEIGDHYVNVTCAILIGISGGITSGFRLILDQVPVN